MRILKKVAACLLVVVMTVSAAGCGSEKKRNRKGDNRNDKNCY